MSANRRVYHVSDTLHKWMPGPSFIGYPNYKTKTYVGFIKPIGRNDNEYYKKTSRQIQAQEALLDSGSVT